MIQTMAHEWCHMTDHAIGAGCQGPHPFTAREVARLFAAACAA